MVEIEFFMFLTEGDTSYQKDFTGLKNIVPNQSYHILKDTGNYSTRVDFNCDFPNMTIFGISKPIFSFNFYPIILKLNLVVLGVN